MKFHTLRQAMTMALLTGSALAQANTASLQCSGSLSTSFGAVTRIECMQDLTIGAGELIAEQLIEIITAGSLLVEQDALLKAPNIYITVGRDIIIKGPLDPGTHLFANSTGAYGPDSPSIQDVINVGEAAYLPPGTLEVSTTTPSGGIVSVIQDQMNVPEPSSFVLMALGLCGLGWLTGHRHQRATG